MDKKNEKVIAKYLSGKDAEYMYETCEETPGTCPVCNNRLEDVINMSYKIRKKKGIYFIPMIFLYSDRNLQKILRRKQLS